GAGSGRRDPHRLPARLHPRRGDLLRRVGRRRQPGERARPRQAAGGRQGVRGARRRRRALPVQRLGAGTRRPRTRTTSAERRVGARARLGRSGPRLRRLRPGPGHGSAVSSNRDEFHQPLGTLVARFAPGAEWTMTRTIRRPGVARAFGAGEIVLFPGKADHLYRVRTGLVRLHTVDDDGAGVTLRYVKPGGYFGEERLIDRPRRYFAEAVTNSDIEELDADDLDGEQQRDLTRRLAAAIDGMNRAMHRLAGKPLRARIA